MKRKSFLFVWAMFAAIIYPGSGACVMGQERAEAAEIYNRGMEYYRNGDYAEALDLFRQAAEQGLSGAQNVIGVMYANGEGVTQSYAEAARWYLKAAGQGNYKAEYNLGALYLDGEGVPQDVTEAAKWYLKAAEQGMPEAQNDIAAMYELGVGVEQSFVKAAEWYRKAAEQGNDQARENLERIQDKIPSGAATVEDIWEEARRYESGGNYVKAAELYLTLAEQGYPGAQYNLGVMYEHGRGVTQSYGEAVRWYLKAAGQGIDVAQCNLGTLYCKGEGVMQDYAEALKWFYKAADQGNAAAQYNLGFLYEEGAGVAKNYEEAKKWYRRAVHQGYLAAEENLRRIEEKEQNSRPADIRSTQNENTATVSVPSGEGGAYYQNQYKNWERRAQANYRSLTNLGISLKNKRTNERTGNTGQGMNSGNYVLMKKNLREAQNQMRNIRQQASRDGVTIPQSAWETATVSY
ncbi:tetratricopeptide repeat protein [Culturomica massiliensis]|uniref:tetratricopeptide repeat protein n=1 Tax=Culturomica massiliensis TaxID=1841857 RepID=UPI0026709B5E|nr:tetratricopeptide repeat protein [Culturomica massiliensis]